VSGPKVSSFLEEPTYESYSNPLHDTGQVCHVQRRPICLRSDRETYTDGTMTGCVNGSYHLDREEAEVWEKVSGFKAGIRIDFAAGKLLLNACIFDTSW